eukprot:c1783_g1_i1.p1 GENE.c1783_g1_i1~~c1783_g1_i1.p1  ORF type:complete len:362 (+),score=44.97 c1783_g1_i1:1-1086(+)
MGAARNFEKVSVACQDVVMKDHGWEFFQRIGAPKYVCAPMVDGSELPFRMLTRKYGVTLAYSPMLHSKLFSEDPKYRKSFFSTCPGDRPLFAQFCANDPETLLSAAKHLEGVVDAIDLNFGCPQGIAKRGHYGAFLLEEPDLICSLVRILHENLKIPVTAKIRLLPKLEQTISLALRIQEAGASILTVHGRTKEMKQQFCGVADWDAIKTIRERLTIPVFSNGNIRDIRDVQACLDYTGCAAVMSAEGLLADPALFAGIGVATPIDLTIEYLAYCHQYPTPPGIKKGHIFWILNPTGILAANVDLRTRLHHASTSEELESVVFELRARILSADSQPQTSQPTTEPTPQPTPTISEHLLEQN